MASGIAGCATSSETAESDSLTQHVGVYPPPPPGLARLRVGVPAFELASSELRGLDTVAADELTTLALQTGRMRVIERVQLNQLLKEQNLAGVVRPDELARKGGVRGVDYLFLGKVTNLRVKAERASRGLGVAKLPIPGAGSLGGFDLEKKSSRIQVDCGVDLRLTDPSSGEIVAAHFGEYKRSDSIGAFGIEILGASASADADIRMDEDNKGKILRLALDDAIRKMLPDIDRAFQERSAR
jgi:curli biogenesis system outer membrane secretion channel CsgG